MTLRARATKGRGVGWLKWLRTAALILLALVIADAILLATHWPFTRTAVIRSLERTSSAKVTIQRYRSIFFPFPGCIAEGVVVAHPGDRSGPPLITVSRLLVQSGYSRILRFSKTLNLIHAEGVHIRIRAGKQEQARKSGSAGLTATADTLVADGTILEFESKDPGDPPFVIDIHRARLSPVSARRALNFEADLHIPTPPGEVHGSGQFGPWNEPDPWATPVSGSYTFRHADLGFAHGIAGILESKGEYRGPLKQLDITDAAAVPDFRVATVNHPVQLTARFHATVNGQTGDTVLHSVSAHFLHSDVEGNGSVVDEKPGGDKIVSLQLGVPRGRIDDFLYLLAEDRKPGLQGTLGVHVNIALPPGSEPFLEKLRMGGGFQIAKGRFTAPSTEDTLNRIRDRSRHQEPDYQADALLDLGGTLQVGGGLARFSNVTFEVPGASARLSGTYNLLTTRTDIRGMAHIEPGLSSATTGLKSVFLKVLSPFFKDRRRRGSDVPIKITGTYGRTSVTIDFARKL
ncbi:MAG: AsmA-like C-terminal region-containing protein [Bryobacteraceae bacterium]